MKLLSSIITIIILFIALIYNSFLGMSDVGISFNKQAESAKPIIITSSATVAVLSSIVAGDDFIIDALQIEGGCPHHYSGKPSDKTKIDRADIAIFVDDRFESFFASMIRNFSGNKYRISSNVDLLKTDKYTDSDYVNWHFWNSPRKSYMALEGIGQFLAKIKPTDKEAILNRLASAEDKLLLLEQKIANTLSKSGNIILLSKSIEPLFYDLDYSPMFVGSHAGLKFVQEFEQAIEGKFDICVVSDVHDKHEDMVAKYGLNHANIDAENIRFSPDKDAMQLYVDYINNLIDVIDGACNK